MRFRRWSRARASARLSLTTLYLLPIGAVGLFGCAELTSDDALQQDIAQLRQDVSALKVNAQRGRGEAEALGQLDRRSKEQVAESARQKEQAAENSRQLDALSSRLDAMNGELRKLSASLSDLSQRVEALRRPSQSSPGQAPGVTSPSVPPPASRPSTGSVAPSESPRGEMTRPGRTITPAPGTDASAEESYQAANRDFSRGNYELAIPAFREFVRRFPESLLADSAQYNIGESYLSLAKNGAASGQPEKSRSDMEQAVQEFRKVIVNYPRGGKVPPALYKEALALTELRQVALAQSRLQYLIDHFPQSEEAPLAKEKLGALKR